MTESHDRMVPNLQLGISAGIALCSQLQVLMISPLCLTESADWGLDSALLAVGSVLSAPAADGSAVLPAHREQTRAASRSQSAR